MAAVGALLTSTGMDWTSRKLCDGHADQVCFINMNVRELCKQRMHLFICSADLHIIFLTSGTLT